MFYLSSRLTNRAHEVSMTIVSGDLDSEPEGRHFLMYISLIMKEVLLLLPAFWRGGRASRVRELHAFVFCAHFLL